MPERSPTTRRHLPTFLVMVGLMLAVLFARDDGHEQHARHPDIEEHAALFEAEHAELIASATAYLRASEDTQWPLGGAELDPDTALHGVTQRVSWHVIEEFSASHTPEELVAFADAGAPLVVYSVAYFRPYEYADEKEVVRVIVGRGGRVVGVNRGYKKPGAVRERPPQGWAEATREHIAATMQIDADRFVPVDVSEAAGTHLATNDAAWRIEGMQMDEYSVVVGAFRHPWATGFGTYIIDIDAERDITWGFEGWIAAALAVSMAVFFGIWATRADTQPPSDRVMHIGFGLGIALALGQIAMMVTMGKVVQLPALVVFGLVALIFGAALVFFNRAVTRGTTRPPTKLEGIVLVALAVLAFVAACMMCGGYFASGCCERCGILRCSVAPLVIAALILARTRPRFGTDAMLLSFAMLMPHCVCDNFIGHGWIATVGASPMCFFLFYGTVLVALIGLRGVFARATMILGVVALAVTGTMAWMHHAYHFPW